MSYSKAQLLAYWKTSTKVDSGQAPSIFNTPLNETGPTQDVITPLPQPCAIMPLILNFAVDSFAYTPDVCAQLTAKAYADGQIVQLTVWTNDVVLGKGSGVQMGASDFAEMSKAGSSQNTAWHALLDQICAWFEANVPAPATALVRFFTEINGNWNWYGAQDNAATIALEEDTWNYVVKTKGVTNLAWVFSPNVNVGNYMGAFPGTAITDVAGIDCYDSPNKVVADCMANDESGKSQLYEPLVATGLPLYFPEIGLSAGDSPNSNVSNMPDLVGVLEQLPAMRGFCVFCQGWAMVNQKNAAGLLSNALIQNEAGLAAAITGSSPAPTPTPLPAPAPKPGTMNITLDAADTAALAAGGSLVITGTPAGGTPTPTPTPPTPSLKQFAVIDANGVFHWGGDWSFGGENAKGQTTGIKITYNAKAPDGSGCVMQTNDDHWAGFQPWATNSDFDTSPYNWLYVDIWATKADQLYGSGFETKYPFVNGQPGPEVPIGSDINPLPNTTHFAPGMWITYKMALHQGGFAIPAPGHVFKFRIQDQSPSGGANTMYYRNAIFSQ